MRRVLLILTFFMSNPGMVSAQHTNLWGVTNEGGTDNSGVIFRYDYRTNTLDTVYNFSRFFAHGPIAPLSYCSSLGRFYSAATVGGYTNVSHGGIYRFDPLTYTYEQEIDFNPSAVGVFPAARLIETSPGYYWSISTYGGAYNSGTIYTYNAVSNTHTIRKSFQSGVDGYDPYDAPTLAPNGKMYGLTHGGLGTNGGVIYELDTLTSAYTIKQQFAYATGNQAQGRLLLATDGNMYGTTTSGGTYNGGNFFRYDYVNNVLTYLFSFTSQTGKTCTGHLIQASDGNIYGVTSNGGPDSSAGTIFRYNIGSNSLTVAASFHTYSTGSYSLGGLCEAPDGLLYGLLNSGGTHGLGTLYAFNPVTNTITKKQDFDGTNGASPQFTDLTVATTNTRPRIVTGNLTDTVCAGSRDTLLFTITDPDNDTMQGTLATGNSALVGMAGSSFTRVGNTNTYRLIFTAAAGVTGSADLSVPLTDGHGAADTLRAAVYVKDCTPPPSTAIAGSPAAYQGFTLFPNPAGNYLDLRLQDAADRIVQLRLTDASGRSYLWAGAGKAAQALELSRLARGMYEVQVVTRAATYHGRVVLR